MLDPGCENQLRQIRLCRRKGSRGAYRCRPLRPCDQTLEDGIYTVKRPIVDRLTANPLMVFALYYQADLASFVRMVCETQTGSVANITQRQLWKLAIRRGPLSQWIEPFKLHNYCPLRTQKPTTSYQRSKRACISTRHLKPSD